jgi:hypothetical protein
VLSGIQKDRRELRLVHFEITGPELERRFEVVGKELFQREAQLTKNDLTDYLRMKMATYEAALEEARCQLYKFCATLRAVGVY